ncbi:hypothetical protein BDV25DRAFT_133615 [Aspergillus avenaceus]|uniref:Gfd2/YDR514C-like C-terminal domain-containing protein n=1 Tax=Aspergillus avenaceus TaxID=36643 RepID=A0A5N6THR9_ASPAV|nr:hypothetical protein BDV25DRAFT_133615 [Aspergillus avenaceus]
MEMERSARLDLLFSEDESLLGLDTHLRGTSVGPLEPEEDSVVKRQREKNDNEAINERALQSGVEGQEQLPMDIDIELARANEGAIESPSAAADQLIHQNRSSYSLTEVSLEPPSDGTFSPLMAISRYPYKYLKGGLSQGVASQFFDGGKFWNRPWDIYYIHTPYRLLGHHILLVPTVQVREFLKEINQAFKCECSLTIEGLVLPFHRPGFPQPKALGRSTDRLTRDRLESCIPPPNERPHSSSEMDETYEAFEHMIEAAWSATRSKKRGSKASKEYRIQHQHGLHLSLRRTQSYLGLRLDEFEEAVGEQSLASGSLEPAVVKPSTLQVDKPTPYSFWKEPIFICIDVESNERFHDQITEVGISVLDTLDLVGVAPGEAGSGWVAQIKSRHLRVEEYRNHVNRDFVHGCPGNFEFGTSDWVLAAELAFAVQDSFQAIRRPDREPEELRNLILVGHSIHCDIQSLRKIGVRLEQKPPGTLGFVDQVDTAEFFRIIHNELNTRSLGAILEKCNMIGWNLHNAGNDARYTLEVLIRMMLDYSKETRME